MERDVVIAWIMLAVLVVSIALAKWPDRKSRRRR